VSPMILRNLLMGILFLKVKLFSHHLQRLGWRGVHTKWKRINVYTAFNFVLKEQGQTF